MVAKSKVKKIKAKKQEDLPTIHESQESGVEIEVAAKIVPCDTRKHLEVYGGCLVYIPLTDEERKVFAPNWNSITSPAWELHVKNYEQPVTNDKS